jgi:hypothetical protein
MPSPYVAFMAVLGLLLALAGCDSAAVPGAQESPSAPAPSSSWAEPVVPAEQVFRLSADLNGPVARLGDLPTEFPASLAELPQVRLGHEATGVQLSYRPRESLDDGAGWSSETIALWLRDNTWAKLSLGSLGLPADLWRGADMIGPGRLNDDGSRLALPASSGVIVIDLLSGGFRHHAGSVGGVGEMRWHPGGRRLTADPWKGRDVVVDVTSGSVSPAPVRARGLGFLQSGEAIAMTRKDGRDVLVRQAKTGNVLEIASVAASPLMAGRQFMSWVSGDKIAYSSRDTVRGRYALRVAHLPTGRPLATLTWSRRTGTFLSIHGWWDRNSLLLSMDGSLVTWTPETGEVVRVASLPRSDIRLAHTSVGINFPEPLS